MTITWITNYSEPNPIFKWGETSYKVNRIAKVEGSEHHHVVRLKNLEPDSTYYYQIPGFRDEITEFKTGPKIGRRIPFSFLFYGDSREKYVLEPELHHEENIELMSKERSARFVLQAGDIANNMAENWREQWIYNFQIIKPISIHIPFMGVAGNHDWLHSEEARKEKFAYLDFYEFPKNDPNNDEKSYWFYYGNVFILVIGYEEEDYAAPEDYKAELVNWVIDSLQYAKNSGLFDWIFIMNHKPAFAIRIEDDIVVKNNTQIRYWHPIFMENGVDFVLNGHNHHYERVTVGYTPEDIGSHNITYLVSGGGGGGSKLHDCKMATFDSNTDPVGDLKYFGQTDYFNVSYHYVKFSINGPRLTLTATKDNGDLLETHTFSK
jgi:predicted phosphodiesterase